LEDHDNLIKEKYINASCVIAGQVVQKNAMPFFENKKENLSEFLLSLYVFAGLNYPRFYKMDDLCKLGWLASEILLLGNLQPGKFLPEETGLVLANANSSLDTDLKYWDTVKEEPSPSLFVYTLPNVLQGEICIRNNFKGESAFFVFEEFNSSFMEKYVTSLLDNNRLSVCIMGWVELVRERYKAVLFKVEKEKGENPIPFTIENINKLFQSANE